ncbi:MAG: tRNA (adenosine(37)-N6)-dimethylallyltransferase MiaA [Alphaproteobacteria bacterium]|nr:tRNA (adenosine(37)-N6)-dimethylallyltransferase MiaA [Alphaproteobacteria bacterium]
MSGDAIIIAGPTASGKSALAMGLARLLGGVVINADALQVYRELRIVTARPSPEDEALVPHRLYGVLGAAEACSAGIWRSLALDAMARARADGLRPILVGGTGLYLKALTEGLAPIPPVPDDVRRAVRARLDREGPVALHAALAGRDPVGAARIRVSDPQRIARATEVLEATGRPLSDWQALPADAPGLGVQVIVLLPARAKLHASIATRLASMVDQGALAEIERIYALGLDPRLPAMKAVAVRELGAYLRGESDLPGALAAATTATRRYAKRQATWFRHQIQTGSRNIITTIFIEEQYSSYMMPDILSKVT